MEGRIQNNAGARLRGNALVAAGALWLDWCFPPAETWTMKQLARQLKFFLQRTRVLLILFAALLLVIYLAL